jgi:hypothetical protein
MQKYMWSSAAAWDMEQAHLDQIHENQNKWTKYNQTLKLTNSVNHAATKKIDSTIITENLIQDAIIHIKENYKSHDANSVKNALRKFLYTNEKSQYFIDIYEEVQKYFKNYRTYLLSLPRYEEELILELELNTEEVATLKTMHSIQDRIDHLLTIKFIKTYESNYENYDS